VINIELKEKNGVHVKNLMKKLLTEAYLADTKFVPLKILNEKISYTKTVEPPEFIPATFTILKFDPPNKVY